MPAQSPAITKNTAACLQALGASIRAQRKALHISATATAEAAGMSRVTLYRIEKGEPSVTIGAYVNALVVLGLGLSANGLEQQNEATEPSHAGWIPAQIAISDYPQLKLLAWQVHGTDTLSPGEALNIYERNIRHLDTQAMTVAEQDLLSSLRIAFKTAATHV